MSFILGGLLLTVLFVFASFGFLIIKYFPHNGLHILSNLNWGYIFLAFGLFFLYHTFDALRLKTIAKGYGINYSIPYAYTTSFIATFGSTITPAHIGGELIIFYMLKRLGVKNHKIWGTILFKTISGLSFFVVAFPIFIAYTVYNKAVIKKLLILAGIFLIFTLLSVPILKLFKGISLKRNFRKKLKLYCYAIIFFWKHKKSLFIIACFYSVLLYLTFLSFAPVLLKAFNVNISIVQLYLIQLPLVYAIFSSPTPGGSGVGELGGVAIFAGLLPPQALGLFVILWRFFSQYLGALIGGILFIYILLKDLGGEKPRGKFYF